MYRLIDKNVRLFNRTRLRDVVESKSFNCYETETFVPYEPERRNFVAEKK